jgi:hypothetical protein
LSNEAVSEDAAWWRGQAAGIPPKALDSDGFPLWPTGAPAGTTQELVPVAPAGLVPGLADPDAYDAGATAVIEQLHLATDHLEQTAAQLSAAHLPDARLSGTGELWPPPAMRIMRQARDAAVTSPPPKRLPRKLRHSRNPAVGLPAMLVIALLAGFFAWTSAEPFWLDMGQGAHGQAQITRCKGDGVLRRCYATFQSESHAAVAGVPLVGADDVPGAVLDARMRAGGRIAYAGNPSGLRVRWTVGLALILLCGAALCWATGAGRLGRLRTRLAACAATGAAPLILGLGVLMASY